ncbi:MAG: HipA domain-containing protein [Candidatus Nanopelagicales bacterium]
MNPRILQVWLHGSKLAELEHLRNRTLRLRFAESAIATYGIGSTVLSLSLPTTRKRVEGRALDTFLEGLLPEGQLRGALERELNVRPNDTFALLRHIGQECAGAIQFVVDGAEPAAGYVRELTELELESLIAQLPTLDPPDELPLTASLGGVQAKVLLTKTPHGWAWPALGAQSTHIFKPEPITDVALPGLIEGEHWAMELASVCGIRVARTELASVGGRRTLIVERYDRQDGVRLHQEDFTQALSLSARDKYESSLRQPSRLGRLADLGSAQARDPREFRRELLRLVTFNVAVGNGDAHSKNYSIIIDKAGAVEMAPLYDCAPVFIMNPRFHHAGHAVNGQVNLNYVTAAHLEEEAVSWKIRPQEARDVVREVIESVRVNANDVAIDPTLNNVPSKIARRCANLLNDV